MLAKHAFCSQQPTNSNTYQLFATAAHYQHLFLLELDEAFQHKTLAESHLPDAVKQHLEHSLSAIPAAKLLCIKQQSNTPKPWRLFYANAHQTRQYNFAHYNDLLSISLQDLIDQPELSIVQTKQPMYLVCTNGKRDRCCAKFGLPIYQALQQLVPPEQVWECSHLGGHRFAPTLIALPYHHCYGNLSVEKLAHFVQQLQQNKIDMAHWRGNCLQHNALQAADYFLRQQLLSYQADDIQCLQHQTNHQQQYHSLLQHLPTDKAYLIHYTAHSSTDLVYEGCSKAKPAPYTYYQLHWIKETDSKTILADEN